MEIGDKSKAKYAIQVSTQAMATKHAGTIYCDSVEEYDTLVEANYDELVESGYFSTNISNDFELCDTPDLSASDLEVSDLTYYVNDLKEK